MNRGPIHLHIDELVLHGFNPGDRHGIADAVQQHLTALLMERGLPAASAILPQLDAGQFRLPAVASAAAIGGHIAQQIHGAVARVH